MSFPAMNAMQAMRYIATGRASTTTGFAPNVPTGPINVMSVPAVVDVSGMEWSIVLESDAASGTPTLEASTADASRLTVTLTDGGPTGDNTAVAVLATAISNTAAFGDTVPRDMTGSSTTDLDADDWVNFSVTLNPTTVPGMGTGYINVQFIYGKPAAIN